MEKGHSIIQVKRIIPEERKITGIASTPALDREGDELDPMGAAFKLPLPLLLGHDHSKPIGQVTEARATPRGIYIVAQIAPEGVTDVADEGWRAIRAGLIRGLSVGFIGRKFTALPSGGRRFTAWELVEISAVTVAANGEAGILEVKRLADEDARSNAVPPYPAHLRAVERQAVLEKAARDLYAFGTKEVARDMGLTLEALRAKWGPVHEAEGTARAEGLIIQRWHGERLASLELAIRKLERKE